METDKSDLRKEVEARILKHAEGSLVDLGGSLVNYCLAFLNEHRQEWTSHGYDQGYWDAKTEIENGWDDDFSTDRPDQQVDRRG